MQYVYVLNKHGEPLMPCSPGKARILLKQQKACVVKRTPFTIKLLYGSAGYKQPITLGVDAGSKHVGLSASTEKRELYSEEFTPRNDVVELLSTRRQNRRSRRNRKTRYRAPRFNNRIHSKHKGWLAPSVEVKIQEHITVIKRICRILPITLVRVETAEFDTQRLKAMLAGKPLPVGTDYQLGEMYDEYNVRQYVLKRDHYTCQCCGAHNTAEKVVKLHVHHLESRKTGGVGLSGLDKDWQRTETVHKAIEQIILDADVEVFLSYDMIHYFSNKNFYGSAFWMDTLQEFGCEAVRYHGLEYYDVESNVVMLYFDGKQLCDNPDYVPEEEVKDIDAWFCYTFDMELDAGDTFTV